MKNLFTTEPQRAQRKDMTLTAETQRRGGYDVGAVLCGRSGQPRRVAPTRIFGLLKSLLLIAAFFISACGGEGGGGGSSPTGPSTTVAFSGSSSTASNTVYMAKNSSLSSGSTLAIDVKVNNVSSVYGAAFDVVFNSSGMTYASYVKGDFLGTVEPSVMLQSGSSNKLVVGVSKQGTATGITGSGTLVTLKFDLTSGGNLTFSNNELRDSSNQQIANVTWSGGTATVQ